MKGRTNISGGGMNINADVENFTVASGSNVTAGNFVQYKNEKSDRKYDTNYGYGSNFINSKNNVPKVLPCGMNRYVRRYQNNGENSIFRFNLVDVSNGFKVLSAFSISCTNPPSFCLLSDGNIAICYMSAINTFKLRIYNIKSTFELLNTYEFVNENVGLIDTTHIVQLGNSKIVCLKMNNCFLCDYYMGEIVNNFYLNFGFTSEIDGQSVEEAQIGDNDWNLYASGDDKFIIFPLFKRSSRYKPCIFLARISENSVEILDEVGGYEENLYGWLNSALWGNAFGINGKVLFSVGGKDAHSTSDPDYTSAYEFYNTRIYYEENEFIAQTSDNNLFEESIIAFEDLKVEGKSLLPNILSSGTAQYVKENVFYVSVCPRLEYEKGFNQGYGHIDSNSRTAIYRVEYDQNSRMFEVSNIVTFDGNVNGYKFGFGQFFESESGDVYYLYETQSSNSYTKNGRWLMKLTYKNGILEIGENTGMVENYTGSGAAIGVAKQSGKAGDVIEVYTPKV